MCIHFFRQPHNPVICFAILLSVSHRMSDLFPVPAVASSKKLLTLFCQQTVKIKYQLEIKTFGLGSRTRDVCS
jgi:hypothetical protein